MKKALIYLIVLLLSSFTASPLNAHEQPKWQSEDLEIENPRLVVFEAFMRCA